MSRKHSCLILAALFCLWLTLLRHEALYRGCDDHDLAAHRAMAQYLFEHGLRGIEGWMDNHTLGGAFLRTYQNFGCLLAVAIRHLPGIGSTALVLHGLIGLVLAGQLFAFFYAARRMGFSTLSSLSAAWLSPLVVSRLPLGHAFESYLFGGKGGLFTQALAVPVLVMALGAMAPLLGGRDDSRAGAFRAVEIGVWVALAFCFHHFFGYMAFLCLAVMTLYALLLGTMECRALPRFALIVATVFTFLCAYQLRSLLQDYALTHRSVFESESRWHGYELPATLALLARGELFDSGRAPVLSLLLLLGSVACARAKDPRKRALILLFALSLVLLGGRTHWIGDLSWLPWIGKMQRERFLGLLHLVGILIAAEGAGSLLGAKRASGAPRWALVGIALVAGVYLIRERAAAVGLSAKGISHQESLERSPDLLSLRAMTAHLNGGNAWLGLTGFHGKRTLHLGHVGFSKYLLAWQFPLLDLTNAQMYAADAIYLFDPARVAHYSIFDVAYVLGWDSENEPSLLHRIGHVGKAAVYEGPAVNFFDVARIHDVRVLDDPRYWLATRGWLERRGSRVDEYPAFVPQAIATRWPDAVPRPSPGPSIGAPGKALSWRRIESGRYEGTVDVTEEGAYGILRTTYHPRWQVRVTGRRVTPKWVSPGFLAFALPKGQSDVEIFFPADPIRIVLLYLSLTGFAALFAGAIFRWRPVLGAGGFE